MRMTPWQFVGILAGALLVWAVYEYWWKYQDQGEWVRGMNKSMYSTETDEEGLGSSQPAKGDNWL